MDDYQTTYERISAQKHAIQAQLDKMRTEVMGQWEQATAQFDIDARVWTAEQHEINNKWARLYDWL
jgi:hypothetical protein